jgi:hypothetical protein
VNSMSASRPRDDVRDAGIGPDHHENTKDIRLVLLSSLPCFRGDSAL